jgi:hypothetical protein
MVQRDEMLSMMSGTTVLFAIVLDELSKTGALSKEGFADILRTARLFGTFIGAED